MIKILILAFCSCVTLCAQAQTVVYSVGRNYNRFVSLDENSRQFNNTYTPAFGNSLEINFQSIPYQQYTFGFALCVDRYGGSIQASSGGLGGTTTTELKTIKTIVSLALYPLDFQWGTHWHFQLGGLLSREVLSEITGIQSVTNIGTGVLRNTLSTNLVNPNYKIGAITSIAYFWEFKKNWRLVPKYSLYGSFTNDFEGIQPNTRAVRHLLSIGISKRLTE